jgi:hypothetical protein
MSQAPTVNRQWPRKRAASPDRKPKRRYIIWVLGTLSVLLLSGLGIAWATGYFDPDPRLAEIKQLGEQMKDSNLTDQQRRELFGKIRKDMRDLPENERKSLEAQGRQMWQQHMAERMNAFFAMSPADQKAELQKEIDNMLRRQREREERQAERAAAGDQPKTDGAGQNGGSSSASRGGGRGGRGTMTEEQRINRGKQMLDNIDPTLRAQMSVHRQMLQQQAAAQGLPLKWNGGMVGGFR